MTDPIEGSVREALSDRAAQINPDTLDRLRAVDYRPRRHRVAKLPALGGGLGLAGVAAAVVATVALTSASPAFAGWSPTPHRATAHQVSAIAAACGSGLGSPVLTDSRGPYTAAIFDNQDGTSDTNAVCLEGDNVNLETSEFTSRAAALGAGQIQLDQTGQRDSQGNDLTMADGRIGSGVTAVTVTLSDGTSVQATVSNGWYMAWWPDSSTATTAQITTASGTQSETFPTTPTLPTCPTGGQCTTGFASGGGPGSPSFSGTRSTSSADGFTGNTGQ